VIRGAILLLLCCAAEAARSDAAFYAKRVAPLLKRRCLPCHNDQLNNAGISFMDRATLLKGGPHGPAVVPGKPDESYLLRTLQHSGDVRMPPGKPLPAREISILKEWIARGAYSASDASLR
jgi:hypothetical protein